jgi:hypothetical protein
MCLGVMCLASYPMSFLKEIVLKVRLKSKEAGGKNFLPWAKTKHMALIVDSKTSQNKNLIDKFIYEADKVVDVYYLDLNVKESPIKNFITFTKQEKNWLGLPNGKAKAKIGSKKYDVLINASFGEPDYAAVISNSIKATCKCGYQSRLGELDLIVARKNDQPMEKYLDELVNYLKMIRN